MPGGTQQPPQPRRRERTVGRVVGHDAGVRRDAQPVTNVAAPLPGVDVYKLHPAAVGRIGDKLPGQAVGEKVVELWLFLDRRVLQRVLRTGKNNK